MNNEDLIGIYIVDKKGKKIEWEVADKYHNFSPVFSPEGRYICFLSAIAKCNNIRKNSKDWQRLYYLLDIKTGEEKLLIENIYRETSIVFTYLPK